MNFHRVKRNGRTAPFIYFGIVVLVFVILLIIPVTKNAIGRGVGFFTKPLLSVHTGTVSVWHNVRFFFKSKQTLVRQNTELTEQLAEARAIVLDRGILLDENQKLKELLDRRVVHDVVLATILNRPNKTAYDTMLLDVGEKNGVKVGARVFAYGTIPVGTIASVSGNTSMVTLFTTPGQKIEALIAGTDTSVTLLGRGGGTFEVVIPEGVVVSSGTEFVLPSLEPLLVGVAEKVISGPKDPAQTIVVRSPVNIYQLKWLQIAK